MPKEKSRRTAKKSNPLKPGMIVLAAVLLWSAKNEPAQFDVTSLGTWILGAILVALLVRAALALIAPLFGLFGALLAQALQSVHDNEAEP